MQLHLMYMYMYMIKSRIDVMIFKFCFANDLYYFVFFLLDSSCISEIDITFIMENIGKMAEHVQVVLQHVKVSSQREQIHRFFNSMLFNPNI